MKKINLSLQWKFFLCIILIIIPTLGFIFTWSAYQQEQQAVDQVINRARTLARQIIVTRQWVTDCGGLMVPGESKGAEDITFYYDDRLVTSRGLYRQFTPSMVTKKLSQYSMQQDLYHFRLTSLTPLNPENKPDAFEKEALERFESEGIAEAYRMNERSDSHLQYVVPLYLEKGCTKCHSSPENAPKTITGGLSVILSTEELRAGIARNNAKLAMAGTGLIFVAIFTLFVLTRRFVIRPLLDLEKMTAEIGKGNLDARVHIQTRDEFETLGTAFNAMAQKLSAARESMEIRVVQATHELSEANRELKTLDQLKSDFLANMSHELRSPLTVIRGGIDYLNRTIKIEDNRNYLSIIDKNLNRLIRLVSDLFNFTKLEAKKIEWSFERTDLTELIEEVIEITSPLAVEKQIHICYDKPRAIYVEFDLERIEQVIVNLIDNAIKFSAPGTEITIRTTELADSVTVAVEDQGVGIPQENLKSIFDKFSTVPSGRDGKVEGTGLGLAICRTIIEAHQGRVWAESTKGVSSTFYFSLPKHQRHRKAGGSDTDTPRRP